MFKLDTTSRSQGEEIMDNFEWHGRELKKTLEDLNRINTWLGGDRLTINGIKKLLEQKQPEGREFTILDIGCGDGAILRKIADWGKKKSLEFKLIGIDANAHAIKIAEELSGEYPSINFLCQNALNKEIEFPGCDIILCTLTLHHFEDEEIISLAQRSHDRARLGVVINDLQRSKIAYMLFQAFCAVFVNNEIARKDGLTSILRGFKLEDLNRYKKRLNARKHHISWKWAFRYQWIIAKEIK